jgi:phospholipid/cholesterol/gamma-HCH transport system permease protein
MPEDAHTYQIIVKQTGEDECTMSLSGRIDVGNAGTFLGDIERLVNFQQLRRVRLKLASVSYLDSAGATAILKAKAELATRGIALILENLPSSVEGLFNLLDLDTLFQVKSPRARRLGIVARIGEKAIAIVRDAAYQITFIGELIMALRHSLLYPGQIRWGSMVLTMQRVGVDALPIVCLINFLVGLTVGIQSAVTLRQFGANIYLADMVALGMVRELGPLMTAILVSGRSGSAFTAEIGTMKVSEEVDALISMGFDPTRFLVIPKILATLLVVPSLTLFGDLLGILGGLAVGVTLLDITIAGYVAETSQALSPVHVFSGVFKSVFFALTIAMVGCLRGFQVQSSAESVGRQTTSSVVSAILFIIILDAIFGILFQVWNI